MAGAPKYSAFEMNLQTLLGENPVASFVAEYFHRQPFSRAGGAKEVCSLGTWKVLGEILASRETDVMVVRDGQQVAEGDPQDEVEAKALAAEGCTILVRHAERHHPMLAKIADAFTGDFHAPVNIHIYATPAGRHGFSWHYDAEDVFILQTAGAKEYSLRKNTVHPWPLEETIPADMRYPAEIMPLMRVLLRAGDWLYIPCGWWHKAEAPDHGESESGETAISLAVGVMSPAAIAIYDRLRPQLLESLLWRQRLPVAGDAASLSEEELRQAYREILAQLAEDFSRSLRDEALLNQLVSRFEAAAREWSEGVPILDDAEQRGTPAGGTLAHDADRSRNCRGV